LLNPTRQRPHGLRLRPIAADREWPLAGDRNCPAL